MGSSSFNHVIHPNHLNETVLHHHHHASAENADASANGEHQSHFIYIVSHAVIYITEFEIRDGLGRLASLKFLNFGYLLKLFLSSILFRLIK